MICTSPIKIKQEPAPPVRQASVELLQAIMLAIQEGVPLWNSKDYAGCTARYMLVAVKFTEQDPRVATALSLCKNAPVNGAMHSQGWILRRAFNSILGKPRRIRNRNIQKTNTLISIRQSHRKRKPRSVLSYSILGENGGYEAVPTSKRLPTHRTEIHKSPTPVRQSVRKRKSPSVLSYSILGETGCGYGTRGIHTEAVKGGSISVTRKEVPSRSSLRHSPDCGHPSPMASSPNTLRSSNSHTKMKIDEAESPKSRARYSEAEFKFEFSIGDCVEARRKAVCKLPHSRQFYNQ